VSGLEVLSLDVAAVEEFEPIAGLSKLFLADVGSQGLEAFCGGGQVVLNLTGGHGPLLGTVENNLVAAGTVYDQPVHRGHSLFDFGVGRFLPGGHFRISSNHARWNWYSSSSFVTTLCSSRGFAVKLAEPSIVR